MVYKVENQFQRVYLQRGPDSHHQFEPDWKLVDGLTEERHNGVSIIWFVELSLIQTINENDEVFIWSDLPLWEKQQHTNFYTHFASLYNQDINYKHKLSWNLVMCLCQGYYS